MMNVDSANHIPRQSLQSSVLERLRHEIVEGIWKPGLRLQERILCERFGISRTQVARNFQTSAEYANALVDGFYQRFLFRQADPGGKEGWSSAVLNTPGFTLEVLIGNLTGSDEYFAKHAS